MNDDIKITDSRKLKNLHLMTKTARHLHIADETSSSSKTLIMTILIIGVLIILGVFIWTLI